MQTREAEDHDNSGPLVQQSSSPTPEDTKEYVASELKISSAIHDIPASIVYQVVTGHHPLTYVLITISVFFHLPKFQSI